MARTGRPPKKPIQAPDLDTWMRIRNLIDEANTEMNLLDNGSDDFSGHRIAVRFGYAKHIIGELAQEAGL